MFYCPLVYLEHTGQIYDAFESLTNYNYPINFNDCIEYTKYLNELKTKHSKLEIYISDALKQYKEYGMTAYSKLQQQ